MIFHIYRGIRAQWTLSIVLFFFRVFFFGIRAYCAVIFGMFFGVLDFLNQLFRSIRAHSIVLSFFSVLCVSVCLRCVWVCVIGEMSSLIALLSHSLAPPTGGGNRG